MGGYLIYILSCTFLNITITDYKTTAVIFQFMITLINSPICICASSRSFLFWYCGCSGSGSAGGLKKLKNEFFLANLNFFNDLINMIFFFDLINMIFNWWITYMYFFLAKEETSYFYQSSLEHPSQFQSSTSLIRQNLIDKIDHSSIFEESSYQVEFSSGAPTNFVRWKSAFILVNKEILKWI